MVPYDPATYMQFIHKTISFMWGHDSPLREMLFAQSKYPECQYRAKSIANGINAAPHVVLGLFLSCC